ncbi:uncharacterized protein LOC119076953 [Bradysia coprophila]|uniref:uncharacterized protein LOC119076953 n=1 Tax=Bradysia coprophila TaxID=38358 RepID=UPI00187DB597|nr:uncharacterized protein LOC119076953 [Bradysia coprophila]
MKITIVFGLVLFVLIQELHTKSTPLDKMPKSSRNMRISEIKSLLSNYIGFQQSCNDLVDKTGETTDRQLGIIIATKIFASKTNTSESDWERIMSGDKALLTADELVRIDSIPTNDDEKLEKMLTILAKSRMNNEDSTRVIQLINDCSDSLPKDQQIKGGLKAVMTVISACSGQSYERVLSWFPEFFKRLHSTDRMYDNLAGDHEQFI